MDSVKHEIAYRRPAFLPDAITAVAALERMVGVRAFYRTVIRGGGEILAEVESCWCCLDALTRHPSRLADDVAGLFRAAREPRP